MSREGLHHRPIRLPQCSMPKCDEIATDELWEGDYRFGQFCPRHSVEEFNRRKLEAPMGIGRR